MKHSSLPRILVAHLLAFTAIVASAITINGIDYRLDYYDNEATVVKKYNGKYSGSIVIPSHTTYDGETYTVTEIDMDAFRSCKELTSVTIPNTVREIGITAFCGCGITSINIPKSVTKMGYWAFLNCYNLTSVTFNNSPVEMGVDAFAGCKKLTYLNLGNALPEIGGGAFSKCSSLTSVTIPNSVTSIGEGAFGDCTGLSSITIGNSVTSIGPWAFIRCSSLTSVTIPNSVITLSNYAFDGCSNLSSVSIGNSVSYIGYRTFAETSLHSVTIPNSATHIDQGAFSGCTNLTSVTIGNSVSFIEGGAFEYCNAINTIISHATTPPVCADNSVFAYVNKANTTLYVPEGSLEAYKAAFCWKDFFNINSGNDEVSIEDGVEPIVDGRVLHCGDALTEVYTFTGAKVFSGFGEVELAPGAYIVVSAGRATKVMVI
ncbi:MAG: leucine-rich repeat domain-containing protein [Muribaculaceae bacterium]